MVSFSAASVAATCTSISNRALSTTAEVDDALKSSGTSNPGLEQLSSVSTSLHLISKDAAGLQALLSRYTAISTAFQAELPRLLKLCESALAVIDKQLRRIHPIDPQLQTDQNVLLSYQTYLELQARLFEKYNAILQAGSAERQEAFLNSGDMRQLVASAEEAAGRVMQRQDILRPRDTATASVPPSKPLLSGSTSAFSGSQSLFPGSPPVYSASGSTRASEDLFSNVLPRDAVTSNPEPAPSSGDSKGKGFLSSLSHSFSAMTAAMRPRPEPFVIPLCQAAMRGDQAQMKGLLGEGANINGRNEDGKTALICAIIAQQSSTVHFLLDKGAGISIKDSKGMPPLLYSVKTGDIGLTRKLLESGADPNERNTWGKPFFIDAATEGDLECVRLLLGHGADPNARDTTGRNLFILAVLASNMPLVRLLAEHGADVNSRDITGRSALTVAILANNMELTKFLLNGGADPNVRDITGQSMLIHAVDKSNVELIKLLVNHGADPKVRDFMGQEVFLSVVKKDNFLALAQLFLERGVNPNQQVNFTTGQTVLLWAIEKGRWDLAGLLLKHGANPNVADRAGKTPLLEAMQKNNEEFIKLLLTHGADPNMDGKVTPFGFARGAGRLETMQVLRAHGALGSMPVMRGEQSVSPAATRRQSADGERQDAPPDYDSLPHPGSA